MVLGGKKDKEKVPNRNPGPQPKLTAYEKRIKRNLPDLTMCS